MVHEWERQPVAGGHDDLGEGSSIFVVHAQIGNGSQSENESGIWDGNSHGDRCWSSETKAQRDAIERG